MTDFEELTERLAVVAKRLGLEPVKVGHERPDTLRGLKDGYSMMSAVEAILDRLETVEEDNRDLTRDVERLKARFNL